MVRDSGQGMDKAMRKEELKTEVSHLGDAEKTYLIHLLQEEVNLSRRLTNTAPFLCKSNLWMNDSFCYNRLKSSYDDGAIYSDKRGRDGRYETIQNQGVYATKRQIHLKSATIIW